MSAPSSIPTVLVHGTYQGPDFRPLTGTVTFSAPGILTFADADLFLAGPVVAPLDETGRFSVRLPATDAPGMNPSGWAYVVKENLSGVVGGRTYLLVLPKSRPEVDLADLAPADPSTPTYTPVPGPKGDPGSVMSVNGDPGPDVELDADAVGALPKWGGTLTGELNLSGPPASYRSLNFKSGNLARWVYQVENSSESGSDAGSNFELSNWSDGGSWKSSVLYGERSSGNVGIGTSSLAAGAKLTVKGSMALRDGVPAAGVAGTSILYSEGGVAKVRQANGVTLVLGRGIGDSSQAGQYVGQYRDGAAGIERWNGTTWVLVGGWQAYTPTWAGFSPIGLATSGGRYSVIGKRVEAVAWLTWGAGSAIGTGLISASLPVPASDHGTDQGWQGFGRFVDGGNPWKPLIANVNRGGTVIEAYSIKPSDTSWTNPGALGLLWANSGASIRVQISYEAA